MVWIGKVHKDHLIPMALWWAGLLTTKSGCAGLYPIWP